MTDEKIQEYINILKNPKYEIIVRNTKKNRITRNMLAITIQDQTSIIRELTIEDFVKQKDNPQPDERTNEVGYVWFFKKRAFDKNFYIKTKVIDNHKIIVAMSCHIDNIEFEDDYDLYLDNDSMIYG